MHLLCLCCLVLDQFYGHHRSKHKATRGSKVLIGETIRKTMVSSKLKKVKQLVLHMFLINNLIRQKYSKGQSTNPVMKKNVVTTTSEIQLEAWLFVRITWHF